MATSISKFFAGLNCPLRNTRWSWGARAGNVILLRTWSDEHSPRDRAVVVLKEPDAYAYTDSVGLDERIVHLKALWGGGIAGYTVIAFVEDAAAHPRTIKDFRDDAVFSIQGLHVRDDGAIVAKLGEPVKTQVFSLHSQTHRTTAGEGVFPVDDDARSGLSTSTYQEKIPAVRAWLIEVCRREETVVYGEVMDRFGLTYYPLRSAMSRIGRECRAAGEPILTALIVDRETRRCSAGLFAEFQVDDDEIERQRCYQYWSLSESQAPTPPPAPEPTGLSNTVPTLEERAVRFAQIEIRPQQQAFRSAVFLACGGKCVVSGCDVPEALEAAHLHGKNWRKGDNSAEDGLLLRRDLHALYDRGLLTIQETGSVELHPKIGAYYGMFDGAQLVKS